MECNIILLLVFVSGAVSRNYYGPVFVIEPPNRLIFSNTSGSQVSCSAHGSPIPRVQWLLHDGQDVTAVPGLRQSIGNGTLYFPPFRAEDYRKDIHSTVYKCKASNLAGTIISRDVSVKAIVNHHYDVQVYHSEVLVGNTAVLHCAIPAEVKEYVTVTSWFKDDSILLPGTNVGGRIIVAYGSGELFIRTARLEDGLSKYSCLTLHSLTQERKRSAPAILTVRESNNHFPPRLASYAKNEISAEEGIDIHLTCPAQGSPPPTFAWFKEQNGHLQNANSFSGLEMFQEILLIRKVKMDDGGKWVCKVSNSFGEEQFDIKLTVMSNLKVHVIPQLQVINSGENAMFNCSVSGYPIGQIQWLVNGKLLDTVDAKKIKFLAPLVLLIYNVTREDRGMYQCIIRNEKESVQGSAELRLGDIGPELQRTFIDQIVKVGAKVSLRCSATGSPPPRFKWLRDGEFINDVALHRYTPSQYLDQSGEVVSYLNITNVKVDDGGLYTCEAFNLLGSAKHSSRISIFGDPFIRSVGPVHAVAGTEARLHCPFSGYPISRVKWERNSQELPKDLRHHIDLNGVLEIAKVDKAMDSGFYKCYVTNEEDKTATREIQLLVHSPPILESFSFPSNLQEGGRAQVTCYVTSGDLPIHFYWSKDGAPLSRDLWVEEKTSEFYSMLIFKNVSVGHNGSYTCAASNHAATVNYTANLMVKVPPRWRIEPSDASVLLGDTLSIVCATDGFPPPRITWMKSKGREPSDYFSIENDTSSRVTVLSNGTMKLKKVSSEDEGYYLCKANNDVGPGLSKVIHLSINEPVRFISTTKQIFVKRGDPTNLLCDVLGDEPIEINWKLNDNVLRPTEHRRIISSTTKENGKQSSINIRLASPEDSGTYRCLAKNPFGRSEYSIILTVQEPPDPPTSIEVIEVGSRSVHMAWKPPFDGNSPITAYLVEYTILGSNSNHSTIVNLSSIAESKMSNVDGTSKEVGIVSSLTPATVYSMKMCALNGIDRSKFSDSVIVKTQEEEPSSAPLDFRIESVGPREFFLAWSVPPKETWNGELLGYIVTWNEHGRQQNRSKSLTVKGWATNKLHLTGLKKFTRYDIQIRGFNSVAAGPASPMIVGTTKEGTPEAPPRNILCSSVSSQIMKVSWKPPPENLRGGIVHGYKVHYRPIVSEGDVFLPSLPQVKRTTSTETYLHGLQKFTNYSIKVSAYNGGGDGVISEPSFCSTEEDLPGPPAAIKALALTAESILVSWLAPDQPNGRIMHYTVYGRESGRVGKHKSYNVRTEDTSDENLMYEIRNLIEGQQYEFWVSATTAVGEGEPTVVASQRTSARAPSRIASFSRIVYKAVKSKVLLPCVAIGNPTPRTRWIYKEKPITFSPFYKITSYGHLEIHSADDFLIGNYTCSAKNLFGEDSITYTLIIVASPAPPELKVQFATSRSIRFQWSHPHDGGATILGYLLYIKAEGEEWSSKELSPERTVHTVDGLRCGTIYYAYLLAHNKIGNGSPSPIVKISTKGRSPLLPEEKDFISSNATAIKLILRNWSDGGCPIAQFSIKYRDSGSSRWFLISDSILEDYLIIDDLAPSIWYQIEIKAQNEAGDTSGIFQYATTTLSGEKLQSTPYFSEGTNSPDDVQSKQVINVIFPSIGALFLIICASLVLWIIMYLKRRKSQEHVSSNVTEADSKKQMECRKHSKEVYTSTAIKRINENEKNEMALYEISPYATFNVSENNPHSVTSSTIDYTVQFKTFGRLEDESHNVAGISLNRRNHRKCRHGRSDSDCKFRSSKSTADSESDETSGDERRSFKIFKTGAEPKTDRSPYETLLMSHAYKHDSSTESYGASSPFAEFGCKSDREDDYALKKIHRSRSSNR